MALTTLANILQRLGLQDVDEDFPAFLVSMNVGGSLTALSITKSGNTLTVTPTPGSPTAYTLTAAANDTMSELVALINALTDVSCIIDPSVETNTPTTLLNNTTVALTTTTNVKAFPFNNASASTDTALINSLIDEADAAIARFCNCFDDEGDPTLESASRTELHDGDEGEFIVLRCHPVTSITTVKTVDTAGTKTTVDSTNYHTDLRSGRIRLVGSGLVLAGGKADGFSGGDDWPAYNRYRDGWPRGFQNLEVVYTAGYATVPADLEGVATDVVCDLFLNRRRNRSASGESLADHRVDFLAEDEKTKRWVRILSGYINHAV